MKKIFLTTAAVLALASSNALAGMENMLYVKVNGGVQTLESIRSDVKIKFEGTLINIGTVLLKSDPVAFASLGVGYYAMDNFRMDLSFNHYFDPKYKATKIIPANDLHPEIKGNIAVTGKIDTLMLNGYVDLADISITRLFVGAGLGLARVSGAVKMVGTGNNITKSLPAKIKKSNNFTYALHAGASTALTSGISGELFYSYQDFGAQSLENDARKNKLQLRSHHVGLGIRFDL